ncbi:MAG: hypothetical protein E6Q97_32715 [Desulfurellales bacterium]|nr:MAG: hypothetical protein E6Q97_32715 [Desulfurellales bacterium]
MRRGFLKPAMRVLESPRYFYDGIHLDFRYGAGALGCYVKAPGAAPTIAGLTSLFTFTGGNQSMYMGPAGLLVASATNTPRIEYDASGNCLGLLMEAARTNLALYSADGTNAAWTKSNTSAAKTATGPDGAANSATTVTASAGNGTILQTVTSASAQRTSSIWLKRRAGTGNVDMTVDGGTGWTTKTITASWARYSITQSAVTNPNFGLRLVTSGDEVDFYGAQLESAAFMSSTIPTTTVAVARTADSCIRTLSTEFSATAGTVVVASRPAGTEALNQFLYIFDDGTLNERYSVSRTGTGTITRMVVTDGGVNQAFIDLGTVGDGVAYKTAQAWEVNDFASVLNGGSASTDVLGTLPTVTTLRLGHRDAAATDHLNGHIRRFDYYPTRLPNGFLTTA